MSIFLLRISIFLFLFSCTIGGLSSLQNRFRELDIKELVFSGDMFDIKIYYHIENPKKNISVYLEGDGFAYVNKRTISHNPTPRHPMVLKMMLADTPNNNVIYIARPCQYIKNQYCQNKYWTIARYSKEIIKDINNSLNYVKSLNKISARKVNLIGFSGGGAVAILLAAIRDDVANIITIAGNLDLENYASYHKVARLTESLNPVAYIDAIKNIPQTHFVGKGDKIIPPFIAKSFVDKVNILHKKYLLHKDTNIDSADMDSNIAEYRIVNNIKSHNKGWLEYWENINKSRLFK